MTRRTTIAERKVSAPVVRSVSSTDTATARPATTASSMPPPPPQQPNGTNIGMRVEQASREVAAPPGETNIQVVVRCRDRNDRERAENSSVIISTQVDPVGKAITVQTSPLSTLNNKTYCFDRVYGAESSQSMLFDETVAPIVDEMLGGYNCTIFAYGQTGTGKTYTMSGDMSDYYGKVTEAAGIIPRALYKLFAELDREDAEYSVKCSFIELYNEELRDLLNNDEDRKCKIFDDTSKKGGVIINGMEEVAVKDAAHGVKILQDGSRRREVAATKCNELSSRSHSVFTITVHIKQATDGEDMLRVGKLNLVDLAGSENIGRSGAENKRAREAGMINQSLLTLGRVINALVDRSQHIPYRESKLTRLLQDSLGGRTKTCIVATISPAKVNMDETVSTLDYAIRAKSIKNKPQLNQMMTKKALIRDYVVEIERLKGDLNSTRLKNGVYMTEESHAELVASNESNKLLTEEQGRKIDALQQQMQNGKDQFEATMNEFLETKRILAATQRTLTETEHVLGETRSNLADTTSKLADETVLRQAHQHTEGELDRVAKSLKRTLDDSVHHVSGLHGKIDRKRAAFDSATRKWRGTQAQLDRATDTLGDIFKQGAQRQQSVVQTLMQELATLIEAESGRMRQGHDFVETQLSNFVKHRTVLDNGADQSQVEMAGLLDEISIIRAEVRTRLGEGLSGLSKAAERIAEEISGNLSQFQQEVHDSYSQLGHDFKAVFDGTQRHISASAQEIATLRADLEVATKEHATMAAQLAQEYAAQSQQDAEVEQAAEAQFLQQLQTMASDLFNQRSKRDLSRHALVGSHTSVLAKRLDTQRTQTTERLQAWTESSESCGRKLARGKEELKQSVVGSARHTNTRTQQIVDSTGQIHAETVALVAAAMAQVDGQTASLEMIVTRAKELGKQQAERQAQTVGQLSEVHEQLGRGVQAELSQCRTQLDGCVGNARSAVITYATAADETQAATAGQIRHAKEVAAGMSVDAEAITETTPKKRDWQYTSNWSLTQPHDRLIAASRGHALPPSTNEVEMQADDMMVDTPHQNGVTIDRAPLGQVDPNTAVVGQDNVKTTVEERITSTRTGIPAPGATGLKPPTRVSGDKDKTVHGLTAIGQENGRPLKTRKRVL